jgi:hypothetical protein
MIENHDSSLRARGAIKNPNYTQAEDRQELFESRMPSLSSAFRFRRAPAMSKGKRTKEFEKEQKQEQRDRDAILDERENLKHLFPADYSPDISVCKDGRVDVMFKLTIPQAQGLARWLKERGL